MVQIQQHDDFINDPHHHHDASTSTTVTTTTSPPHHHRHNDSPSSASSISSDHTFHAFSPPKSHLPSPSPPPPQQQQPSLLPVVSAGRLIRQQPPETVTKTETDAETGFASAAVSGRKPPQPRAAVGSRGKGVKWVEGFLRFMEFAACLVSFAVMASDKRRGWALDSFDRYVEFRYAMTVNVIGFAYSGLQGLDLLRQLIMGKDLMQSRIRYCFDFAMDQGVIRAYVVHLFHRVNTDAAIFDNGQVGLGAVIRDTEGRLVAGGSRRVEAGWGPDVAEAKAIAFGLELAESRGLSKIIVESDAKVVVDALRNSKESISPFGLCISDICRRSGFFESCLWSHVKRGGNTVAHHVARMCSSLTNILMYTDNFLDAIRALSEIDLI